MTRVITHFVTRPDPAKYQGVGTYQKQFGLITIAGQVMNFQSHQNLNPSPNQLEIQTRSVGLNTTPWYVQASKSQRRFERKQRVNQDRKVTISANLQRNKKKVNNSQSQRAKIKLKNSLIKSHQNKLERIKVKKKKEKTI